MSRPLSAWIEGIGFIAPGLPDWPSARAVLRGETALTVVPSVLPAPSLPGLMPSMSVRGRSSL